MSVKPDHDWNPGTYSRFRGLRLRPAMDLLAQVGDLPAGPLVDLGCGAGAVAGPLGALDPARPLIGIDSSPAMLADAEKAGGYTALVETDISTWTPDEPPALIFSNAALQWLPRHETLMPRLARRLAPGGVLAVQMPRQFAAPSHALMRALAAGLFPDRFDFSDWTPPVAEPADYARMLCGYGPVNAWETTYIQRLEPVAGAHPVRRFTESTAMRPFVEALEAAEIARFVDAYEDALAVAYPLEADGTVLFPFLRTFFVLRREG